MNESQEHLERAFQSYLATKKALVADSSGTSRGGLAKILVSLGIKQNNLILLDNYKDALECVRKDQPEIVVAEYNLGGGVGLDLAEETKHYRNQEDKVFVLVTSNSSQSTVAQAVEEDVDVFILKPYTIKVFSETFSKSVYLKMNPSDYMKVIRSGKKLLEGGDPDNALSLFVKATTMSERPSLAYYYRAQAEITKKLFKEAESSYQAGLKFNSMHYKCLSGYFDFLIKQKRNAEAYSIVKQISQVFPTNPNRLGQVLSLAISTQNYADVSQYYESFKEIEVRSDDLVKYVCASLVVCGKHYFRSAQKEKALDVLKKASVSAAGRTHLLREVVTVLVENQMLTEAEEALRRFPETTFKETHYIVAQFLVKNLAEREKSVLIPELRAYVREGLQEPVLWYWLIYHLVDYGKEEEAEGVYDDAIRIWPAKAQYFDGAFRDTGS